VELRGDLCYLIDRSLGLRIVDVADPTAPVVVGEYFTLGDYLFDIEIHDDFAYLAFGAAGLRIVDVGDPTAPRLIHELGTTGFSQGVDHEGDLVVVADGAEGLRLLDVGNPLSPYEVGRIAIKGSAAGVDLQGGFAYVASYPFGVSVIDVGRPSLPKQVGFFDTAGTSQSVSIQDKRIYLVDMEDGLWILEHEDAVLVAGVGDAPSALLQLQAWPNPFNPETRLDFVAPAAGRVRATIHAADGSLVCRLFDGELPAGPHSLSWRGRDDAGRPRPSGVYFARVLTGGAAAVVKLTLVK
jgi:hypothetical protein